MSFILKVWPPSNLTFGEHKRACTTHTYVHGTLTQHYLKLHLISLSKLDLFIGYVCLQYIALVLLSHSTSFYLSLEPFWSNYKITDVKVISYIM